MTRTERRRTQRIVRNLQDSHHNADFLSQQILNVLKAVEKEINRRTIYVTTDPQGKPVANAWDLVKVSTFVGYICHRLGLKDDVHELIRQAVIKNMMGGKIALGQKGHLKYQ